MKKGTKVKIFGGLDRKFLAIGEFIGDTKTGIPKFKLNNKTIKGCECWWITVTDAKKIEDKLKNKSK